MTRKLELPKEPFELITTGLSSHAEGIGRYENKVIFAEGALPSERCLVKIFHDSRKMARANVVKVLDPSPERVTPPCPYYQECGGCQFQHLSAQGQLKFKQQTVADALHHVGHLELDPLPVISNGETYHYRNKMTFPLVLSGDKISIGLHRRNSFKEIVPLGNCLLIEKPMYAILPEVMELLNQVFTPMEVYRYYQREGNLRYLGLRSFHGKLVINLVMREYDETKSNAIGEKWLQLPNVACVSFYESPDVNEYDWGVRPAKLVLGESQFEIPFRDIKGMAQPLTFMQTNTRMTTELYEYALNLEVQQHDALFDGYCGIGLFSLALAKDYAFVLGVETDTNAINSAKSSAMAQNIHNTHFIPAPVEHILRIFSNPIVSNPKPLRPEALPFADEALAKLGNHKFTTVILDPPRAGCHPRVIKRLGEIQPLDIIFISCHPATLARDLAGLVSVGYKVLSVQPFDLFPQTFHVETVVHLRKA